MEFQILHGTRKRTVTNRYAPNTTSDISIARGTTSDISIVTGKAPKQKQFPNSLDTDSQEDVLDEGNATSDAYGENDDDDSESSSSLFKQEEERRRKKTGKNKKSGQTSKKPIKKAKKKAAKKKEESISFGSSTDGDGINVDGIVTGKKPKQKQFPKSLPSSYNDMADLEVDIRSRSPATRKEIIEVVEDKDLFEEYEEPVALTRKWNYNCYLHEFNVNNIIFNVNFTKNNVLNIKFFKININYNVFDIKLM